MIVFAVILLFWQRPHGATEVLARPGGFLPVVAMLLVLYLVVMSPVFMLVIQVSVRLVDVAPLLPVEVDPVAALMTLQGFEPLGFPLGMLAIFATVDAPVSIAFGVCRRSWRLRLAGWAGFREVLLPLVAALTGASLFLALLAIGTGLFPGSLPAVALSGAFLACYVAGHAAVWAAGWWIDWSGGDGGHLARCVSRGLSRLRRLLRPPPSRSVAPGFSSFSRLR